MTKSTRARKKRTTKITGALLIELFTRWIVLMVRINLTPRAALIVVSEEYGIPVKRLARIAAKEGWNEEGPKMLEWLRPIWAAAESSGTL
jgi:hypothetical protein